MSRVLLGGDACSSYRLAVRPPAVILLSGGLDSATVLALARSRGHRCLALTFDYGQRHRHELDAARTIAAALGAEEHRVIRLDPRAFAGSALTSERDGRWVEGAEGGTAARAAGAPANSPAGPAPAVPKHRDEAAMGRGIPVTYVPARNLVFLSMAVATAESIGARDIFIGVNAVDYSGYPDCRPAFIAALQEAARLGTRVGVEAEPGGAGPISIHDPLVRMSKAEIIRLGVSLGVDYAMTISCYDPVESPRAEKRREQSDEMHGAALEGSGLPLSCGACDACILRQKGFAAAGVPDPTRYAR